MRSACVVHASQDEKKIISALMTPYLAELGQTGEYEYLPCYWREPDLRVMSVISSNENGLVI